MPRLTWDPPLGDPPQKRDHPQWRIDTKIPGEDPGVRLLRGDCLDVLEVLKGEETKVDLVIIDPPFATGNIFDITIPVGTQKEPWTTTAYCDIWGGIDGFLEMMAPRLRAIHEALSDHGSLYVHLDPTGSHYIKVLLDEIFGPGCFQREIVWRIGWVSGYKSRAKNWIRNHDTILYYVKDPKNFVFNKTYTPYPDGYLRRDGKPPTGKGIPIDDVWNAGPGDLALTGSASLDSIQIKSFSKEKTGWATQKNESLLRRIIEASSNPGDLVADFFCGSGSTLCAASSLGRRGLGCDKSPLAVHISRMRLRERYAGLSLEEVLHKEEIAQKVRSKVTASVDHDVFTGQMRVTLEGFTPGYPEKTVEDLQARMGHWSDWVDVWTVEVAGEGPHRPHVEVRRDSKSRTLQLRVDLPQGLMGRVRVRVTDILGMTSEFRQVL